MVAIPWPAGPPRLQMAAGTGSRDHVTRHFASGSTGVSELPSVGPVGSILDLRPRNYEPSPQGSAVEGPSRVYRLLS